MVINEAIASKIYKQLSSVPGFVDSFPHLMKQLKRRKIWSWDNLAITGDITEEQARYISLMEAKGEYVYAVVETYHRIDSCPVHMISYLYVTDDDEGACIQEYNTGTYYALADVFNETWGMHDVGDIVIQECIAGGPRRIG